MSDVLKVRTPSEIYASAFGLDGGVDGVIRTNSGIMFNIFDPKDEMININDIAHALSNINRFGGHLDVPYSVAQHSVMCAMRAKELYVTRMAGWESFIDWRSPEAQVFYNTKPIELEALLHDASEAYILDIPTPIKNRLAEYKPLEDRIMRLIGRKYGFSYPLSDLTKEVDAEMLVFEWETMVTKQKYFNNGFKIWSPEKAKKEFLKYFNEIFV